jgi:hypothetical protein
MECLLFLMFPILFAQIFIIINVLFPTFREALFAGRVNLFVEASDLFTHAAFQLAIIRKMVSECILQGSKNCKSEGAKSAM